MAFDDGNLDDVVLKIDGGLVAIRRQLVAAVLGNDLAGKHAHDRAFAFRDRHAEMGRQHRPCLDAVETHGCNRFAGGKQGVIDDPAAGKHHAGLAVLQTVDDHEIGAPARCNETTIAQTEGLGGGNRGGAVDGERLDAAGDRRADHIVEMALFGDIERVAVIGAERQIGRQSLGYDWHQGVQVLRDRAFAHQNMHALADFLQRLRGAGAFMFGADAGGEITVQRRSGQKWRVPVDMLALEGLELCHAHRVLVDDAGKIHEFGKADDLRMIVERQQLFDRQIGA
ncbi:hypothetical protein D3C71_648280 [compost metagenome]